MTDPTRQLFYLLKILGPTGRQMLKDQLLERAGTEPEAGGLLKSINNLERALGQLDRMTDDERVAAGLEPRGAK